MRSGWYVSIFLFLPLVEDKTEPPFIGNQVSRTETPFNKPIEMKRTRRRRPCSSFRPYTLAGGDDQQWPCRNGIREEALRYLFGCIREDDTGGVVAGN